MRKSTFAAVVGLAAAAWLSSSSLQAQELKEGRWSGIRTLVETGAEWDPLMDRFRAPLNVAWEVERTQGRNGVSITLVHALGSAPLTNVRLEGETLSYSFIVPGRSNRADCRLTLQEDGSYAGDCSTGGVVRFHYTFAPPEG